MDTKRTPTITFEPVTGTIGADVHGVDLHDLDGASVASTLQHALAEHGVLFFRAEPPVTDDEFKALGYLFGEAFKSVYGHNARAEREVAKIEMDDGASSARVRTNQWHTDSTALTAPPYAAALTPEELPGAGGDTMWASMFAAYDALSSHWQRMLDGMDGLHSTAPIARYYPPERREITFGSGDTAVHPVVPTDPFTGRKYLYVNRSYTEGIVGMSSAESDRLLEMLFQHINTPEFHVRLRWQVGNVAVWNERVTQHRAVADWTERRVLRRIMMSGDPPAR